MRFIIENTKYLLHKNRDIWKTDCCCPFIHERAGCWKSDLPLAVSFVIVCWIFFLLSLANTLYLCSNTLYLCYKTLP